MIVVDDRRDRSRPLPVAARVVAGEGRGPAAARNAGWRAARADWVAFLDDDVLPPPGWRAALEADLRLADDVAATQGRIVVPVPERPTDWERNVKGLEQARWATADMAYRRDVLAAVGGFDERFPRAYREDADLGLRVVDAGWRIVSGARHVVHPGRPGARVDLGDQAGRQRRRRADAAAARPGLARPRRRTRAAAAPAISPRPPPASARSRSGAARSPRSGVWRRRSSRGRGSRPARGRRARSRRCCGRAPRSRSRPPPGGCAASSPGRARGARGLPAAILFDRDGTLIADVPYNGDPERVEPMPGAREALRRVREAGVPIAVVSNQSGIARGLVGHDDVAAIHARMETLLGPLGPLEYCPHGPDDGCACRKPEPGLILRAAARLGVAPGECAMVGDIGADVGAARAAGARAVLVPTPRTLDDEVAAAPERAATLEQAVDLLLGDVA